jgi:hypothetical protein
LKRSKRLGASNRSEIMGASEKRGGCRHNHPFMMMIMIIMIMVAPPVN